MKACNKFGRWRGVERVFWALSSSMVIIQKLQSKIEVRFCLKSTVTRVKARVCTYEEGICLWTTWVSLKIPQFTLSRTFTLGNTIIIWLGPETNPLLSGFTTPPWMVWIYLIVTRFIIRWNKKQWIWLALRHNLTIKLVVLFEYVRVTSVSCRKMEIYVVKKYWIL